MPTKDKLEYGVGLLNSGRVSWFSLKDSAQVLFGWYKLSAGNKKEPTGLLDGIERLLKNLNDGDEIVFLNLVVCVAKKSEPDTVHPYTSAYVHKAYTPQNDKVAYQI